MDIQAISRPSRFLFV